MQIEDTFGEIEDIYYNSKDGDFIVNKDLKQFGFIKKEWTKMHIINQKDTLDWSNWYDDRVEVYRVNDNKNLDIQKINYDDLMKKIKEGQIKLVYQHKYF